MDIRGEIAQSKDRLLSESIDNVQSGNVLNPTPLSRFDPQEHSGKKTLPVKQPRFNPFDAKKNKSPLKKKPTGDVSEAAQPVEFEVNVQAKAIVDKGKESSAVIDSVVADLQMESEKEKEKEEKEKEKESEENVIEKVVESENEESGKLVTYKSKKGKKSSVVKDKSTDVVVDKKLKMNVKVTEPVKTTPKKKSAKVISEAAVLTSKKPVQEETQKKRKLVLSKVNESSKKQKLKVPKDVDEKKSKINADEKNKSKKKRGDSSISDKGKKKVKDDSVKEDVIPENVMKQLMKTLLKNSLVKVESDEQNELKPNKKGKKKEKVLTEEEKQHQDYLKKIPILQARSAPTALHTAIHGIKNVDVQKFLEEIGFSSYFKFDINKIPARLGRYVVDNFDAETCQLKLEGGKSIQATVNKVHELLGIPIGGESLLSLETRQVGDDFEKVWFGQFETKSAKQIRVNDIASKLIESKEVDFLFKVNFLTLFTNTMGMVAGLQGEINLDVVKRLREDTDIRSIDWCEYIFHCLKLSRKPTTLQNKYTGPYTFLALLYLDSTKYNKLSYVRTRPAIKYWSSFLMSKREDMELKEEVMGTLDVYDESELPDTEGFVAGCSTDSSCKEELLKKIEEKLSILSNERIAVEELFVIGGVEFPADPKLIELHQRYVQILEHPVSLDGEDLDRADDNGGAEGDDDTVNDKRLSGTDP